MLVHIKSLDNLDSYEYQRQKEIVSVICVAIFSGTLIALRLGIFSDRAAEAFLTGAAGLLCSGLAVVQKSRFVLVLGLAVFVWAVSYYFFTSVPSPFNLFSKIGTWFHY